MATKIIPVEYKPNEANDSDREQLALIAKTIADAIDTVGPNDNKFAEAEVEVHLSDHTDYRIELYFENIWCLENVFNALLKIGYNVQQIHSGVAKRKKDNYKPKVSMTIWV